MDMATVEKGSDRVGNGKYLLKNKIGQGSFGYIFMG